MKNLRVTKPSVVGSLPDGEGGFIELLTNRGPIQLHFPNDQASQLVAAVQLAMVQVAAERKKLGLPVFERVLIKKVDSLEVHVDRLKEVVVMRTRFQDQTMQDTPVARDQIQSVIESLTQALQGFQDQERGPVQ